MSDAETRMVEAVAPLWSTARTLSALNLTEAELRRLQAAGAILGVPAADDSFYFPLSQFEKYDGGVRVQPALARYFRVLRNQDPWSVALIATAPQEELDGLSPVDWAKEDRDPAPLVDFAYLLRSEWSG